MNWIFPVTIALACLLVCTPAAADVHKCNDAQGNVTYRDTPCGGTSIAIKRKSTPASAPPDADVRMEKTQRLLRAYDAERQEENKQKAEAQAEKAKRERNCARAKDRLRRYERAGNLYNLDKDGNRVYMSDEARQQSIERARADMAQWCK